MPMDALWGGLHLVIAWPASGLMLLGIMLGLYFGAVPGLGGMIGFSLLLPFTFGMDPVGAFALLLGMYAVTTTSDTLSAVLLGVPGTAAAAATVVDGYPLAKRGQAMRALGASYTASALGGVIGATVGAASLPILKPIVLSFAPPEFFLLGVLGLTFVGALSGSSALKGALGAFLGLLIATVGYSTQGGIARYSFEVNYLLNGFEIVPVVLGLFSVPEIIELATKGLPIAQANKIEARGQILQGVRDVFQHWWLTLRCTAIGLYIGFLPGIGGSVSDWAAYGHAVQTAKDKSQFGRGDIRGVIAPQAAENATKPGDLLPTVAFGIPGSAGMSILLGAFLMHGLRPGPEMLTTRLDFTFSLMWTLAIANVIGALILMVWSRQIAKITFVRGHLLVPGIIVFTFMGAWMSSNQLGDWIALLGFGVIGYVMRRLKWPRPPVVLGFVLGPIMETNLDLSRQALGWTWLERPWVMAMLAVLVLTVVPPLWRTMRRLRQKPDAEPHAKDETPAVPYPVLSVGLATLCAGLFVGAYLIARHWTTDANFFPIIISIGGGLLALASAAVDLSRSRFCSIGAPAADITPVTSAAIVFGILAGMIGLSLLIGQQLALPLTVACYLWLWAREKWQVVLAQAIAAAAILYLVFDRLLHPIWIDPIFRLL
jgi:TctA family transporter